MKWTKKALRAEVWRILRNEVKVIYVTRTPDDRTAECVYDEKSITIWTDGFFARTDHAVIHEIFHKILDPILQPHFNYWVQEEMIIALEKFFFKGMSNREKNRWRRAIMRKVVRQREKQP